VSTYNRVVAADETASLAPTVRARLATEMADPTSDVGASLSGAFDAKRVVNLVTDYGADPTGTNAVNSALQNAFDYLDANDGTVLYVPPGDFRLTRTVDGTAGQMYAASIMRGTVFGDGDASHFYLDPAASNPSRYYLIRVGRRTVGTTGPVTISGIRLSGNESVIGGSSVMGIAARHDDAPTRDSISSDDVSVSNVTFEDVAVGVGSTKGGASLDNSPENRFKRWHVDHIKVLTCSNKAVEFGDVIDAYVGDSYFSDVYDGPQAIYNCSQVWIVRNRVYYRGSGINITHECEDFWIIDNYVEADSTVAANSALMLRTEPFTGSTTTIQRGVIRGNTFINGGTAGAPLSLLFQIRPTITSLTVKDVLFDGNYFSARSHLYDADDPTKNIASGLRFVNNRFGMVFAVATAASQIKHVTITRNTFEAANQISGGGRFDLESNIFKAGLTLGSGTSNFTSYRDLTNTGSVTDSGTGNSVTSTRTYTP